MFVDRDGMIKLDTGYVRGPDDVSLPPGAAAGLKTGILVGAAAQDGRYPEIFSATVHTDLAARKSMTQQFLVG